MAARGCRYALRLMEDLASELLDDLRAEKAALPQKLHSPLDSRAGLVATVPSVSAGRLASGSNSAKVNAARLTGRQQKRLADLHLLGEISASVTRLIGGWPMNSWCGGRWRGGRGEGRLRQVCGGAEPLWLFS